MNNLMLVGGAAALVLGWQQFKSAHTKTPRAGAHPPMGAGAPAAPWKQANTAFGQAGSLTQVGGFKPARPASPTHGANSPLGNTNGGQPNVGEQVALQHLRELEEKAKNEYNKLEDAARERAAMELNTRIKPSPNLTGKESWEEASRKVGAAVGAAAATAGCAIIPYVGAALAATGLCATLGAMIGAYVGEKFGPWAKELYADVAAWADKNWDKAAEYVGELAGDAYEEVTSWF